LFSLQLRYFVGFDVHLLQINLLLVGWSYYFKSQQIFSSTS
jgi:hypothetical protein